MTKTEVYELLPPYVTVDFKDPVSDRTVLALVDAVNRLTNYLIERDIKEQERAESWQAGGKPYLGNSMYNI